MTLILAADLIVVFHVAFVAFAVLGGLLVLKWPRLVFVHVPAAAWGVAIEFGGWICPLTPLENSLRQAGGGASYPGDFVEHYLVPLLYPADLTRARQLLLGSFALIVNAYLYWRIVRHRLAARPIRTTPE